MSVIEMAPYKGGIWNLVHLTDHTGQLYWQKLYAEALDPHLHKTVLRVPHTKQNIIITNKICFDTQAKHH